MTAIKENSSCSREGASHRFARPFICGKNVLVAMLTGLLIGVIGAVLCWSFTEKVPYWNDEVFSHFFLADSNFSNMWRALQDQINPSPPVYWVLGWLWATVFGSSEFSLRMFSVGGAALGGGILCLALARSFGPRAAAVATLGTVFGCRMMTAHLCEARFYPLFFAAASLALWASLRAARENVSPRDLIWLFVSQALLAMTHVHGVVFAFLMLACVVLCQLLRRANKVALQTAACGLAGEMVLLTWLGPLKTYSGIDSGKPEIAPPLDWLMQTYVQLIPVPPINALKLFLFNLVRHPTVASAGLMLAGLVVSFLVGAAIWRRIRWSGPGDGGQRWWSGFATELIFASALLLSPTLLWLGGHIRTRLFIDRYCLPSVLGTALLLGFLICVLSRRSRMWAAASTFFVLPLLCLPVAESVIAPDQRREMRTCIDQFAAYDHVLCESLWPAIVLGFYSPTPHYHYVLDEVTAMGPENTHDSALSLRTGQALRRHYRPACILTQDEARAELSWTRFLVIDSPYQTGMDRGVWERLGYVVTDLGPADVPRVGVMRALLVEQAEALTLKNTTNLPAKPSFR
jgi:hypothetical protein